MLKGQDFNKNSYISAEAVIDKLCDTAGNMLYESYLMEKVRPYELKYRSMSAKEACQFKFVPQ